MKRLRILSWAGLLALLLLGEVGFAHGGEDHGEEKESHAVPTSYFSSETVSDKYEVLIKYPELIAGKETLWTLFLANANTNVPVSHGNLKITNPDDPGQAFVVSPIDSGTYEVRTTFTTGNAPAKVHVAIDAALGPDLLQVQGIAFGDFSHPAEALAHEHPWLDWKNILSILVALLLGLVIGYLIRRKTSVAKKAALLAVVFWVGSTPFSNQSLAHGDEDHGKEEPKQGGSSSTRFIVPKETQFLFEIETRKINSSAFASSATLYGTIVPSSSGSAVVQSPQTGVLKSLSVEVGQTVAKGQLLAMVEQAVDANTQVGWVTQRNSLEAELEAAQKELDRMNSIQDIAARKDIEEAKRRHASAKNNLEAFEKLLGRSGGSRLTPLYAPIAGKVERFNFSIGSTVSAGQDIFQITNLGKVYVEAQVFGGDVEAVRKAITFLVEGTGSSPKSDTAHLVTAGQSMDPSNQSQRMLFELENADGKFKLGELVNLRVIQSVGESRMAVPDGAVVELNGKPAVFVKEAAEGLRIQYLALGESNGQSIIVLSGIESGEKVVTSGAYQIKMMYLNQ